MGVPALERIMTVAYNEKPMIIVVTHRRTVLTTTLLCFRLLNNPQKSAKNNTSMNVIAPLLNGRPNTLTKSRSVYAAAFGRNGIIPKRMAARIRHESMKMPHNSLKEYEPFSRIR